MDGSWVGKWAGELSIIVLSLLCHNFTDGRTVTSAAVAFVPPVRQSEVGCCYDLTSPPVRCLKV